MNNIGVIQLTGQAGLHIVDIDAAQLVPLGGFLFGQTYGFCLGGQFIDSCDYLIDAHNNTSYIAVDDHGYTALFRLTVDGFQLDFAQSPHGNFYTFRDGFVRFFARQTVNGYPSRGDILGGLTAAHTKTRGDQQSAR